MKKIVVAAIALAALGAVSVLMLKYAIPEQDDCSESCNVRE